MSSAAQKVAPQEIQSEESLSVEAEVIAGLARQPRQISPKYFYDQKGSELFDAITGVDEYYVPRVEKQIFEQYADEMCAAIGKGVTLIEPGAGSCEKIKWLLPELEPATYVPMDISAEHLEISAQALGDAYPELCIEPLACDHTAGMRIEADVSSAPPVFFYPGSSVGNYEPEVAVGFLRNMHELMEHAGSEAGGLLIGVDAKKDSEVLHAAYNDSEGLTADFNINVLTHLNNLLDGSLDADKFVHHALYNDKYGRIEMHLRCTSSHSAELAGQSLEFSEGELVHTENSYKYHPDEFVALAEEAGFAHRNLWQDDRGWFSVMYFEAI